MKKRVYLCLIWLVLAGCLYFFENNTGTRAVLACSLLLPLVPAIRRALLAPDAPSRRPETRAQTVSAIAVREQDEPGDVRGYLPGDPVNRIHWKLSAKRDALLVCDWARDEALAETEQTAAVEDAHTERKRFRRPVLLCCAAALLALLLILLPSARLGAQALANRLFDASERVNAYAYARFPAPEAQPVTLAALLLALGLCCLLGAAVLSESRWPGLALMAGCALFQVYFGLAFPAWVNVPLFALFALSLLARPWKRRAVIALLAGIAAVSLAVLLLWPGVDAATEAASERARDRLGEIAQRVAGVAPEAPAGENETRRTHTQSLTEGDNEARADREFRLVTVEEAQISRPRWVDYIKIILLLLLTAALLILPFLPFLWLNRGRRRALAAREAFRSGDVSAAVCAIFRQVIAWLEATGNGAGNLPYAAWTVGGMPLGYAARFTDCARLFEEAAYSDHALGEEQRARALDLLAETERTLWAKADWKQRLRLKYKEFLWM